MRNRGTAKIERKRTARLWILAAIQNYQVKPEREAEPEIKRFIRRIQRDILSLSRGLIELEKSRKSELARLIKSQRKDENDRKTRFEHAIRK